MFSLFSSDIFITLRYTVFLLSLNQLIPFHLRVYAISFRNKTLVVYFGTLASARLAVSLASAFARPVAFVDLPPIPIDALNFCPVVPNLQFRLVPNAIGTAFGEWVVPVSAAGVKSQRLLITGISLELSAFLVIGWCVSRNMRTLRISAVIRTIVAEATIYFLAMVALQIYIQLSYVLMEVQSLSPGSHSVSWSPARTLQGFSQQVSAL